MNGGYKIGLNKEFTDLLTPPGPIKVAQISSSEIKSMDDEEIIAILTGEQDMGGMIPFATQQVLSNELLTRTIKTAGEPHWTTMPSFWLLVVTVVISGLALLATIFAFPQVQQLSNKGGPPSQLIQSTPELKSYLKPTQEH